MKVVVLHSGGQDSTTCLAWAIDTWGCRAVYPIMFDYGQRHAVELEQAVKIANRLSTQEPEILSFNALTQLGGAALTDADVTVGLDAGDTGNEYAAKHGLPSTFVPGRNLLFFTLAAAYAAKLGSDTLVTGVCATDRAGYPDCRVEFVDAAQRALSLALDQPFRIVAPLLRRTKGETWDLANSLGILDIIIEDTHTCYHGVREELHTWGYGCGQCPACDERRKGFDEFHAIQRLEARLP